jgi:acyl-CoA synthetase (AMP-forming)/AMP-acid ligase II
VAQFQLADLFEIVVDTVPDRLALVAGDVRLTYAELDQRANRLAHALEERGVRPDDHVAVYSWNRAEWVEAWWACYKIRAVPINVNYRYSGEELRYLFDNADAVTILHEPEFTPLVRELAPGLPKLRFTLELGEEYEQALAAAAPERTFGPRSADDHYVLYTGGTTGMPKGVVWRHEDIFFAALGGNGMGGQPPVEKPDDLAERAAREPGRTFILPPLMHGAAQWGACNCVSGFLGGGTIYLNVLHKMDADAIWRYIADEKIYTATVVGDAMARPLADALEAHQGEYDLSSFIALGSGGAILSRAVKEAILKHLPNIVVNDAYGASETGAGSTAPSAGDERPRFLLNNETAVLDDDLRPIQPGSEKVGRMARTGHIPLGYYGDPAKTARTFPTDADGRRWVVPGDFATVDEDGGITLLGRGSQCINTGGEKVYPEEVESVLKAHPAVYDALVVGVPDERFGERVAAVVQVRDGQQTDLDDLQQHCRSKLAGYKIPRSLVMTPAMPRSPAGKADYRGARALFDT